MVVFVTSNVNHHWTIQISYTETYASQIVRFHCQKYDQGNNKSYSSAKLVCNSPRFYSVSSPLLNLFNSRRSGYYPQWSTGDNQILLQHMWRVRCFLVFLVIITDHLGDFINYRGSVNHFQSLHDSIFLKMPHLLSWQWPQRATDIKLVWSVYRSPQVRLTERIIQKKK